jgi:hypothetical protein
MNLLPFILSLAAPPGFIHSPVVWRDHDAWWTLAGPTGNTNMRASIIADCFAATSFSPGQQRSRSARPTTDGSWRPAPRCSRTRKTTNGSLTAARGPGGCGWRRWVGRTAAAEEPAAPLDGRHPRARKHRRRIGSWPPPRARSRRASGSPAFGSLRTRRVAALTILSHARGHGACVPAWARVASRPHSLQRRCHA